jgi:hypothetical protein
MQLRGSLSALRARAPSTRLPSRAALNLPLGSLPIYQWKALASDADAVTRHLHSYHWGTTTILT